MSTSVIEPGTRLAGRYRLEERIRESGGSTLWKAIDEILARAVAVRTFAPEFPRIGEVVTAARSASRLTDPRLTQVFDADDSGELAYVVSEWVTGETLEAMVTGTRPMDPGRAATLLCEAAQALAAAHFSGLYHLRLTPRDLLWTTGNTVKILGLGVDAALAGVADGEPGRTDTRGLTKMLYASLTGFWPESAEDPEDASVRGSLPAAPDNNGTLCNPRQITPGVPQQLDSITCRGLGLAVPDGQEPLTTPAALAEALARTPRIPLPLFAGLPMAGPRHHATPAAFGGTAVPAPARPDPGGRGGPGSTRRTHAFDPPSDPKGFPYPASGPNPNTSTTSYSENAPFPGSPSTAGGGGPYTGRAYSGSGPGTHAGGGSHAAGGAHRAGSSGIGGPDSRRLLIAAAAVLALVIVAAGLWMLTQGGGKPSHNSIPSASSSGSSSPQQSQAKLVPAGAEGFDPTGKDGSIGKGARNALSGGGSPWHSEWYATAEFGHLKKGIGLLVDMGAQVSVSRVTVNVPANVPGSLELRVGDQKALEGLKVVGRNPSAAGQFDITLDSPAHGRYVLLWFTRLPQSGGQFKAQVSQVSVYGTQG